MASSKRRGPKHDQAEEKAWGETKAAVRAYTKNPCAATEQAVSEALGHVKELHTSVPEAQKRPKAKKKGK